MNPFSLARSDLAAFAALCWPGFELAPHIELLVSALEQVERGECKPRPRGGDATRRRQEGSP